MKCDVCGITFEGTDKCPTCGFQYFGVVDKMSEELKQTYMTAIEQYRYNAIGDKKVILKAFTYKWNDNDELVVDTVEEIPLGADMHKKDVNQITWIDVPFAKSNPGDSIELNVVIESNGSKVDYKATAIAPDVDSWWNVGMIIKPGFKISLVLGNQDIYSETNEIDLRG